MSAVAYHDIIRAILFMVLIVAFVAVTWPGKQQRQ
jgi:hypothetical protein